MDNGARRVLEALSSAGPELSTIVIYSTDQEFYMGEHGWFDKRWIYEESLQLPFIIRWPGLVNAGTRFTPLFRTSTTR